MRDSVRENATASAPVNRVFYKSSADMAEVPAGSIALIVTSPPYYCIKDYSRDGHQESVHSARSADDYGAITDYREYLAALLRSWRECCRVLQPNGKLAINAPLLPMPKRLLATHHNRDIFNIYADIEQSILSGIAGIYLMDVYIWNRTNSTKSLIFGSYPYPGNLYAQNTAEFIGIFVKEGPPVQRDPATKAKSMLSQADWRDYTKQIWNLPGPHRGDAGWGPHAALMPMPIAQRCIRMFSYVGDCILDPFAGSGTTLAAAKALQRHYIGYEIYRNYEPVIKQKLSSQPAPPKRLQP